MAQSNPTGCCALGVEVIRFEIIEACCAECWAHVEVEARPAGVSSVTGEGDDHWDCDNAIPFTVDDTTDVLSATAHGLSNDAPVKICSTGTPPPPSVEFDTIYYVLNANTDDLQLSTTMGGTAVNFTGAGSGTHSLRPLTLVVESDPPELIVWDSVGCALDEPDLDLVGRKGYAQRLTRVSDTDDPCGCMPATRWEIVSICPPEPC